MDDPTIRDQASNGSAPVSVDDQIEGCQRVGTYMLESFARACEEIGVPFTLSGGTLLGAVRNGGWIPWDDDVDVSMLRRDYNAFRSVANSVLPDDMYLSDPVDNKQQATWVPRINYQFSGLRWVGRAGVIPPERQRIVVDIFIADQAPDRDSLLQIALLGTRICQTLTALRTTSIRRILNARDTRKVRLVALMLLPVSRVTSRRFLAASYVMLTRLGANSSGDRLVFYNHSRWTRDQIFQTATFEADTEFVEFEGRRYLAPTPSTYLGKIYGSNYLQPPEADARIPHKYDSFWARLGNQSWGEADVSDETPDWVPARWRNRRTE